MVEEGGADALREDSSLLAHLNVILRHKWVILQAVVLVPLAAVALALRQDSVYQASADVLISRGPSAAGLGLPTLGTVGTPERTLQTQADLAAVPAVAAATLAQLELSDRTPQELLAQTRITPKPGSDVLQFTVADGDGAQAARIATEYARQFTVYRRQLDTGAIRRARRDVAAQLTRLERENQTDSAVYDRLVEKERELATVEALLNSNASLIRPATGAQQIAPQPARNAVLGLLLGLFLGVGLAFLWEALDTRVRTTREIERRLGLPLLARVRHPPRWIERAGRLTMLAAPESMDAEAYRVLRTNFEFFNMQHGARVVMVTSATQGEGKSTTVANLAVALSRAGQRVVLVDLDLRRPRLDRFFGLEESVGVTDVVRGTARLSSLPGPTPERDGQGAGRLEVLTSGPLPRDTGEFVGSPGLARILDELRERADVVLIDAPPLLAVGDAIALSAKVDGVIVLTRLDVVRRGMIDELRRVLGNIPAAKIGFVVTAAEAEQEYGGAYGYRYGYGYGYGREQERAPRRKRTRR